MRRRPFLALLIALVAPTPAVAQQPPAIAAAASLRYALDEASAAFTRETGKPLRISYAASGNLVQQIRNGAPYQLFLSADEDHVLKLADEGRTLDRGKLYAVGRLALVASVSSALKVDPQLAGLRKGLADGSVKKLAIANPETAPYGTRAREALIHANLWKQAQPHLVTAENIGQAFQFATTGGADGGFVSLSLVLSPGFTGRYAIVPESWHKPLVQRMALVNGAGPTAHAFHDWLLSPRGQAVLARYGYGPPPR